ncbi:MAG: hypothetical protein IT424_09185 [Pirellulales bacterium]|nr:hypothetical protein [Pirellulales bacterium]
MSVDSHGPIEQFVAFVRRRVNLHRFWTALVWAAAAGAGALAAVAAIYVWQGYATPAAAVAVAAVATMAVAAAGWFWRRLDDDASARLVDRFYGLQDSVASYLHFKRAGRKEGFYALQADYTRRRLEALSPLSIRYQWPRRGIALAAGLAAVALPLSLRGPSPEVLERLETEKAVQAATETANKELKELVDELEKGVDDPLEKELVDPDKLRQMVDKLQVTKDRKEALRQYAELERDLNKARLALERKKEEQLLARAAEKLDEQPQTQPLADELKQKNYDQAAEQLTGMKPPEDKPLSEQRKQLARLKAAAQRMAAAAQANRSASQDSASKSATASASKAGESSQSSGAAGASGGKGGSASAGGGELGENMEELASAVEELDESLKEAERQQGERGECDSQCKSQCQACQQAVNSALKKLCKNLNRLSLCRNAEKKLSLLCDKCSQCQGMCNGLCQIPSPKAGGKKAGWGSNTARRDARDGLADNGQTTELKGTKGQGPSLTTIESADDGSGVSHRRGEARQRQFQRQFESFVEREDVPAQVREGVKQYFQLIHQMDSEPAAAGQAAADEGA